MSQFSTLSYIVYFLTNQGLCKLTDHTKFCLNFLWSWSDQGLLIKFIDIITGWLITQKERYKSVLFIFITFSVYNCIFLEFMLYLTRTTVLQGGLTFILHRMGVVLMDNNHFDFNDLMAFGMFVLALLTFVFTFIR